MGHDICCHPDDLGLIPRTHTDRRREPTSICCPLISTHMYTHTKYINVNIFFGGGAQIFMLKPTLVRPCFERTHWKDALWPTHQSIYPSHWARRGWVEDWLKPWHLKSAHRSTDRVLKNRHNQLRYVRNYSLLHQEVLAGERPQGNFRELYTFCFSSQPTSHIGNCCLMGMLGDQPRFDTQEA